MSEDLFKEILDYTDQLHLPLAEAELASLIDDRQVTVDSLLSLRNVIRRIYETEHASSVTGLLKTSRLPKENPKTFENFDFGHLHGKDTALLKELTSLSPMYLHKSIAFIGPPGVGKTHLAMAFGYECCQRGYKAYYIKASELHSRLAKAVKYGRDTVGGLVRPSCLIIDEIGRCEFSIETTRLFFDIIDRRNEKQGANCIIFTSNKFPKTWKDYFREEDSLLCALDRAFDAADVYIFKGKSYRGRQCRTMAIKVGDDQTEIKPDV